MYIMYIWSEKLGHDAYLGHHTYKKKVKNH